jgi:hypothetical protein
MQEHRSQAGHASKQILAALLVAAAMPAGSAFAQQQPGPPSATVPSSPPPTAAPQPPPPAATLPQAEPDDVAAPRTARERREARRERAAQRNERQRERQHARDWRRTLGPFALAPLCGPGFGRRLDNDLRRIERVVAPTDAQRDRFDDLRTGAARSRAEAQEGCDDPAAPTPTARMKAIEERLASVQRSVQTLRGPLDAFYGSLNDEQKARFDDLNLSITAGADDPSPRERRRRWRPRYYQPMWPFWPGWR